MGRHLHEQGRAVHTGTMVDATLMDAPRSTRKEHPWSFGMKAPIGVDCRSRRIHSVAATAAPMHDSKGPGTLLQGEETRVRGDAAYPGSRRGDARPSATCSGPHPWKGESEPGVDRARALVPSRQSEGGASVSGFQTLLRPLQGTRPGLGEERQSAARRLWAGRSVHGSTVRAAFHVEKVCRLHADEVDWTATAVLSSHASSKRWTSDLSVMVATPVQAASGRAAERQYRKRPRRRFVGEAVRRSGRDEPSDSATTGVSADSCDGGC